MLAICSHKKLVPTLLENVRYTAPHDAIGRPVASLVSCLQRAVKSEERTRPTVLLSGQKRLKLSEIVTYRRWIPLSFKPVTLKVRVK